MHYGCGIDGKLRISRFHRGVDHPPCPKSHAMPGRSFSPTANDDSGAENSQVNCSRCPQSTYLSSILTDAVTSVIHRLSHEILIITPNVPWRLRRNMKPAMEFRSIGKLGGPASPKTTIFELKSL